MSKAQRKIEPEEIPAVTNSLSWKHIHYPGERPKLHDKDVEATIPNQSMTIKEMVERYNQGLSMDGTKAIPMFNGEDFIPSLQDLDLADREEFMDSIAAQLLEVRTRLQEVAKTKQKQEELRAFEEKYQAWLKSEKKEETPPPPTQ